MQDVEQFDKERQILSRPPLYQSQDELALFQADEVVGVFATSCNSLEIQQPAEPVRGEKGFQLGPSQGWENGHEQGCQYGRASVSAPVKVKGWLPLEDLPRGNQHIRLVGTDEVTFRTIGAHQKVRFTMFGCDLDGIQKSVLPVLLNRFIPLGSQRDVRVCGGGIVGCYRHQWRECKQASQ